MTHYEYSDYEWRTFTTTEKRIITMVRGNGISEHLQIRQLLNWPLEEPFNATTYRSIWSRLKAKVRAITQSRVIQSSHAGSEPLRTENAAPRRRRRTPKGTKVNRLPWFGKRTVTLLGIHQRYGDFTARLCRHERWWGEREDQLAPECREEWMVGSNYWWKL